MSDGALAAQRQQISESSEGISSRILYDCVLSRLAASNAMGTILDVGAGQGEFTRRLYALPRFQSVTGADLMARPANLPAGIDWIRCDLNAPLHIEGNSFDAIVSLGLIEYLENSFAFARELFRLLRPGGVAILTTPNNESWRSVLALIARGHFIAFAPGGANRNLVALLRADFRRIFHYAGFAEPVFSFTGQGSVPALTHMSWQGISGGLLRGVRFSDDVIVAVAKPPL